MTPLSKSEAESLIPLFQFQRILNQDQNGRRISLLGTINSQPSLLVLERAAFPTDPTVVKTLISGISHITNLGANDIYHWYMGSSCSSSSSSSSSSSYSPEPSSPNQGELVKAGAPPPDLKLNLIHPCTPTHIAKYSPQPLRMVTETPAVYTNHVRPFMLRKREEGRLNWVFNILDGKTEQEDVILRDHCTRGAKQVDGEGKGNGNDEEGFLLLPDLNWDRETVGSLHLLALVERRDIWSLRDLKRRHVTWLRHMRERILKATVKIYGGRGVEEDMLKLYVHYQPTYYHFHIHVVSVMLEAEGNTQATGKAFGLENIISQLETMGGDEEVGMADTTLTYFLGEASEVWEVVFGPLKRGELN